MLTIWGRIDAPNVRKVVWCLEELGCAYKRIDVGGKFGGTDTPAYRAMNPNGFVPTLADGGFTLWEAHAIMRYLCACTPGQTLVPNGVQANAIMDQWLDWQTIHQAAAIRDLGRRFRTGKPTPTTAELAPLNQALHTVLAIVDSRLGASPFVAGDDFTLADIPIAIGIERCRQLSVSLADHTAVEAWFERMSARDAYKRLLKLSP